MDYKKVQRANAEEVMGEGDDGKRDQTSGTRDDSGDIKEEHQVDDKRKFEASKEEAGVNEEGPTNSDSIAKDALVGESKPSEEPWEGEPEEEKENFVQEELYIHAKVCIVDDRIVICGSANINDRVST